MQLAKAELKTRVLNQIILTLDMEEAEAIRAIAQAIGGYPESTPRGLIDGIDSALKGQGVKIHGHPRSGGVFFE